MKLQRAPVAKAEMLIRKPAAEVFEAFVNPAVTTKFWFTKSSGGLEAGKQVRWDWEMYGHSEQVTVKAIENLFLAAESKLARLTPLREATS